jgi:hypothetical protein
VRLQSIVECFLQARGDFEDERVCLRHLIRDKHYLGSFRDVAERERLVSAEYETLAEPFPSLI